MPVCGCFGVRVFRVRVFRCAGVSVCECFAMHCRYVNMRVFRCAGVSLCECFAMQVCRCAVVSVCRCLGFLAFHGIQSFAVIILLIACTVNDILIITCLVIVECGITTDDYKQCKSL